MKHLLVANLVLLALALSSCGNNLSDTGSDSASEVAAGGIAGVANSTEANGTLAAFNVERSGFERLKSFFNPIGEAYAAGGQCKAWANATCDANGKLVLDFAGCGRGLSQWSGGETFTFDSQATCQARLQKEVPTSGSVVRTFNDGTTRTLGNIQVALDTTTPSGYETPVSGGVEVDFSTEGRTVKFQGLHIVATNLSTGKTRWDHTMSGDAESPLVITGSGASKSVVSGKVILQHNLAKETATVTVKSPLTFTSNCCHPTGGEVQTDYTGQKEATETLTFKSTCGTATLTKSDGTSSDISLKHCF